MSLLLPLTHGSAIDAFLADPATTSPNEPPQHMITKAELQIQTEERIVVRTVLITDRNYYEFRLDDPITFQPIPPSRTSLTKTKPLIDIHSVETVQGQPRQFVMHFFSGSVADKTKRQLSRMKRLLQSASITPSFIIKTKIFTCATPFHTIQWIFLLQRLIRNLWQQTFENQFIPSPEIYQRHCFVIKKSADRILLISTRWMYNIAVTFKPTLVKDLKWAIPLATLTLITINTDDTCPNAQIMFDEMEAAKHQDQQHTGHKNKTGFNNKKHKRTISTSSSFDTVESITTGYSHAWIFRTVQERNRTVTLLVRLHLELTGKQLQVEVEPDKRTKTGTGPAFLEELVLRNQTGHTLQPSRIKNENISYETTREMTVAEGDEDGISSQPIKSGKDKEKCIIE